MGLIPGSGRSPGEGHDKPLQYSWLDDSMDRGGGLQSMGFSRQEYWSGLPFPSAGDLPNLGIERKSPSLQADSLPPEPPEKPCEFLVR